MTRTEGWLEWVCRLAQDHVQRLGVHAPPLWDVQLQATVLAGVLWLEVTTRTVLVAPISEPPPWVRTTGHPSR